MVVCLEQGADFLVLAHPGSPGKRATKRVCVCYQDKIHSFKRQFIYLFQLTN